MNPSTTTHAVKFQGVSAAHKDVMAQYAEEAHNTKYDEDIMLRQKYGVIDPKITGAENMLIQQEEMRHGTR